MLVIFSFFLRVASFSKISFSNSVIRVHPVNFVGRSSSPKPSPFSVLITMAAPGIFASLASLASWHLRHLWHLRLFGIVSIFAIFGIFAFVIFGIFSLFCLPAPMRIFGIFGIFGIFAYQPSSPAFCLAPPMRMVKPFVAAGRSASRLSLAHHKLPTECTATSLTATVSLGTLAPLSCAPGPRALPSITNAYAGNCQPSVAGSSGVTSIADSASCTV